ncbi:MAG: energy transducer TonB [Terracidiphilus sp.]
MRRAAFLLALLALAAGTVWAQQELAPSTDDGPLNIKPVPLMPDKDGVYSVVPGIVAPVVVERAAAGYPAHASTDAVDGVCLLSLVVGADGVPRDIQVVSTHGAAFDAAAIDALRQFKFEPGTMDGKPVPVRVYARTRFFADMRPAVTRIMARDTRGGGFSQFSGWNGGPAHPFSKEYDKPPIPSYSPAAEFSDEARRKKIQGTVIVSALVNEEGLATDLRVEKSLGYGLDEKALQCIRKYRFQPAVKDGVPVAARIAVEVNFHLY